MPVLFGEHVHVVQNHSEIPENYTGLIKVVSEGCYIWFSKGKRHREGKPAIVWLNKTVIWYCNGKIHRQDGPAVIHPDGKEYYYLQDVMLTKEEFLQRTKKST